MRSVYNFIHQCDTFLSIFVELRLFFGSFAGLKDDFLNIYLTRMLNTICKETSPDNFCSNIESMNNWRRQHTSVILAHQSYVTLRCHAS